MPTIFLLNSVEGATNYVREGRFKREACAGSQGHAGPKASVAGGETAEWVQDAAIRAAWGNVGNAAPRCGQWGGANLTLSLGPGTS